MRVLQIGRDDWSAALHLPAGVDWSFVDADDAASFDADLVGRTDVTVVDALAGPGNLAALDRVITPYTLLVARHLRDGFDESGRAFLARKAAVFEDVVDRQALVDSLPRRFFARQFGQKLEVRRALVSPFHHGDHAYEGSACLTVPIAGQEELRQLVTWKENIAYDAARPLELWPEFVADPGCEVELVLQLIQSGTPDVIVFHRRYTQEQLAEPILVDDPTSGYLVCSIFARGTGTVNVGPIHYRHSRLGSGHFLPGGRRIVDSRREELFTYFHPGNLTPPFNVYFAGYRPAEGFEGFFMMAGLGQPFLLVTDPRLEGGRFYLGSEELEGKLMEVIRGHVRDLGFTEEDVIFSGLSMGSFGALYYGSQLRSHAIVAGKPIIDLGYVAERGRLVRPREFFTVFDLVNFWDGSVRSDRAKDVHEFTRLLLDRWRGRALST